MEKEEWREEYVLNDTGKIYVGNYKQVCFLHVMCIFGRVCNIEIFQGTFLKWLV